MPTDTRQKDALELLLVNRWQQIAGKIADLAKEIPDDRFNWRPVDGVRSCADVLRHVAFWNRYVAGTLRGQTVDDTANELSAAEYPTKASVCDVLQRSANDVVEAMSAASRVDASTAAQVIPFVEHTCEHYGQLVVYARSLGIVPPASRA
jgi:uncharacterized damage-inducible protein DinB